MTQGRPPSRVCSTAKWPGPHLRKARKAPDRAPAAAETDAVRIQPLGPPGNATGGAVAAILERASGRGGIACERRRADGATPLPPRARAGLRRAATQPVRLHRRRSRARPRRQPSSWVAPPHRRRRRCRPRTRLDAHQATAPRPPLRPRSRPSATPVSAQAPAGTQAAESLPASTVATGTSSATSAPGSQPSVAQTTPDAPSMTAAPTSSAAAPTAAAPTPTGAEANPTPSADRSAADLPAARDQPPSPQPDPGSAGSQGSSSSPAPATPVTVPATAAPQPADTAKATAPASSVHAATAWRTIRCGCRAGDYQLPIRRPRSPRNRSLSPPRRPLRRAPPPPAAGGGVPLAHAIETVRMTIEMAASRGYSQARIDLSPPELGSIRIHLHQTADGLVARVVAEHGAAAQTLQQGGQDLRRSLEQAGLPLLRLDIEASGQQAPQGREPQLPGASRQPRGHREHGRAERLAARRGRREHHRSSCATAPPSTYWPDSENRKRGHST